MFWPIFTCASYITQSITFQIPVVIHKIVDDNIKLKFSFTHIYALKIYKATLNIVCPLFAGSQDDTITRGVEDNLPQ